MYTAVCMSNDRFTQSGFEGIDHVAGYIEGYLCDECNKELTQGYYEDSEDGEQYPIDTVLQTGCGAQWLIVSDEDFESSKSMIDLFIAAGLEPAGDEAFEGLTDDQKAKIIQKREEAENEDCEDDIPF